MNKSTIGFSLMSAYEQREEEIRRYNTSMTVSRKEGREEGREETAKKHALILMSKRMSLQDISEVTGLTIEQIAELKKDLK